jgi:succinate dehydrogenase / fumarate reductase membrane anchor subunit
MAEPSNFRSPLGRARHHGSGNNGYHHWWSERVMALALIPLLLWLAFSVALLAGQPYPVVVQWLSHPVTTVLMLLTIYNMFSHGWMGLHVVMEDYIADKSVRMPLAFVINSVLVVMALLCAFAVLKIALV